MSEHSVEESKQLDTTLCAEPEIRVYFFLTGFGKFLTITNNPTTHLMREIRAYLEKSGRLPQNARLVAEDIVHVSAWGVNEYFKHIPSRVNTVLAQEPDEPNVIKHVVFLHFGVASGTPRSRFEEWGYNHADIPSDEAQTRLLKARVLESNSALALRSTLPVEYLSKQLASKGIQVDVSHDPGRYVCNYMCFSSLNYVQSRIALRFAQNRTVDHTQIFKLQELIDAARQSQVYIQRRQDFGAAGGIEAQARAVLEATEATAAELLELGMQTESAETTCQTMHSLFTHVPEFDAQSKEVQLEMIVNLMVETTAYLSKYSRNYCMTKIPSYTRPPTAKLLLIPHAHNYTLADDYVPPTQESARIEITAATIRATYSTE